MVGIRGLRFPVHSLRQQHLCFCGCQVRARRFLRDDRGPGHSTVVLRVPAAAVASFLSRLIHVQLPIPAEKVLSELFPTVRHGGGLRGSGRVFGPGAVVVIRSNFVGCMCESNLLVHYAFRLSLATGRRISDQPREQQ